MHTYTPSTMNTSFGMGGVKKHQGEEMKSLALAREDPVEGRTDEPIQLPDTKTGSDSEHELVTTLGVTLTSARHGCDAPAGCAGTAACGSGAPSTSGNDESHEERPCPGGSGAASSRRPSPARSCEPPSSRAACEGPCHRSTCAPSAWYEPS
ncbi:hypothetical protein PybrP1_003699 [[Pythium] brassicae (nom. inval.)]|nr:hypothetical protein PybrP1_003699 [[Pythium] brassicae (nom. inval.)]